MALKFRYPDLLHELTDLERLAGPFLANPHVLQQYTAELNRFQYVTETVRWQIQMGQELRTRVTTSYEVDDQGVEVYGAVSGVWEIRKIDRRTFQIVDLASFSARIIDASTDLPIAAWNFDIGAVDSPGAWLHSQVKWHGNNLPVPRFPTLVVTLVDVVDFLLGELYQLEWPRTIQRRQSPAQNNRLVGLLEDMLGTVKGKGARHGLMTLKMQRPSTDLFTTSG
jgi:hypothetical protein